MSTHRLFADKSGLYACARPRYPNEIYDYLAAVAPSQTQAWDCACGNGQVALDLTKHFARVEATDVSEEQIAQAPPAEGVTFSVHQAESTPFADHAFDVIAVGQALHWFDYQRFWPEVDRLLKPGGVFAAWGYNFFQPDEELESVLAKSLYPVIQPYWSERNRLLWDHYREVTIPYRRLDAPKFQLVVEWNLGELLAYVHTWSAVRRCMEEQGDDFYQETRQRVSQLWGDATRRRKIEMDFCFVATQKDG